MDSGAIKMAFDPYRLAEANKSVQMARANLAGMQQEREIGTQRLAGMKQDQQFNTQRLSDMQRKSQEERSNRIMQFGANTARQIEQNPNQAQSIYQSSLNMAKDMGFDVSALPQQYDEQAQQILQNIRSQVEQPVEPTQLEREAEYYSGIEDPTLKRQVGEQAGFLARPEKDKKDMIDRYQQLKQINPEQAEMFARAKGMLPDNTASKPSADDQKWINYQNMMGGAQKLRESGNIEAAEELEIKADQYGQFTKIVQPKGSAIELTKHYEDEVTESQTEYMSSAANSTKLASLADQILEAKSQGKFGGGSFSSWKRELNTMLGTRDIEDQLRTSVDLESVREMVKYLPPGPASDKDVALIREGLPPSSASGDELAEFLQAIARVEKGKSKFMDFKSNYIASKGTDKFMTREWKKFSKIPDDDLQYLQDNPETANDFEDEYGILPPGFINE